VRVRVLEDLVGESCQDLMARSCAEVSRSVSADSERTRGGRGGERRGGGGEGTGRGGGRAGVVGRRAGMKGQIARGMENKPPSLFPCIAHTASSEVSDCVLGHTSSLSCVGVASQSERSAASFLPTVALDPLPHVRAPGVLPAVANGADFWSVCARRIGLRHPVASTVGHAGSSVALLLVLGECYDGVAGHGHVGAADPRFAFARAAGSRETLSGVPGEAAVRRSRPGTRVCAPLANSNTSHMQGWGGRSHSIWQRARQSALAATENDPRLGRGARGWVFDMCRRGYVRRRLRAGSARPGARAIRIGCGIASPAA